jgi:hypothetical protein
MGKAEVDGSYREQQIQQLCHECGEATSFSCVDCRQPRCDEHRDTEGPRCLDCRVERRRMLSASFAAVASVLGGLALAALFFAAPPATVALLMLWGGLVGQILAVVFALAAGLRSTRRGRLAKVALLVSATTLPALLVVTLLV